MRITIELEAESLAPPPPPPRRPRREPVEVYAFQIDAGDCWSLFAASGDGGWQEDFPEKGQALFAASHIAEGRPIPLSIGTAPWGQQ